MTTSTPAADASSRVAGWSLVIAAGLLATAAGVFGLAIIVSAALDGSGQSSGALGLGMLVGGLVVGTALAAFGFARLGVTTLLKRVLLGMLTAIIGTIGPWVVAALAARFLA